MLEVEAILRTCRRCVLTITIPISTPPIPYLSFLTFTPLNPTPKTKTIETSRSQSARSPCLLGTPNSGRMNSIPSSYIHPPSLDRSFAFSGGAMPSNKPCIFWPRRDRFKVVLEREMGEHNFDYMSY